MALVTEQGYKISEAARSLDVGANLIGRWRRQFEEEASGVRLSGDEREELKRLRKEVRQADGKRDFKKSQPVLREGNEVKYDFIGTHANDFPVKLLCRQLGVQRSAYDWRAQPGKLIAPEELALRRRMKELFALLEAVWAVAMMMKNLRQEGFEIGRDKTRRLMKSLLQGEAEAQIQSDDRQQSQAAGGNKRIESRVFTVGAESGLGIGHHVSLDPAGLDLLAVIIDLYSRRGRLVN